VDRKKAGQKADEDADEEIALKILGYFFSRLDH
jgi:hypothetical protein